MKFFSSSRIFSFRTAFGARAFDFVDLTFRVCSRVPGSYDHSLFNGIRIYGGYKPDLGPGRNFSDTGIVTQLHVELAMCTQYLCIVFAFKRLRAYRTVLRVTS